MILAVDGAGERELASCTSSLCKLDFEDRPLGFDRSLMYATFGSLPPFSGIEGRSLLALKAEAEERCPSLPLSSM